MSSGVFVSEQFTGVSFTAAVLHAGEQCCLGSVCKWVSCANASVTKVPGWEVRRKEIQCVLTVILRFAGELGQ